MPFIKNKKKYPIYHYLTIGIIAVSMIWSILPMLVLRGNYVFTVHDGLDSYGGVVQNIFVNSLYFHMNQAMPFMHGIQGKYTFISYNLYDFYNCVFGYVTGQILTRITSTVVGFLLMKYLLEMIMPDRDVFQNDMIMLLSVAYAITPVAPNRSIGFATLPAIIILFIKLHKEEKLSRLVWFSILIPFLSIFDAILVFTLGIWFVIAVFFQIKNKRINWNLNVAFLLQCIFTILVNWAFFIVALSAEDTSRGLAFKDNVNFSFNWAVFKDYLLNGQYHSTALQKKILLPFLLVGTIYSIYVVWKKKDIDNSRYLYLLLALWICWLGSAFIETFQESGFRTGVLLIDGFQWGRVIGLMRIGWYLMFACILFIIDRSIIWRCILYTVICLQLLNIATAVTTYNDTRDTIRMYKHMIEGRDLDCVTYNEFYSTELFDEIKQDIDYKGEGVAAYGFHPAVLINNCFYTLDGYDSVHSMEWQNQFREIIAPALDLYQNYQSYYDNWGGRMYLFGELSYEPDRNKEQDPYPLYINTDAFVKFGGKYILSRAPISNAEDIGLAFVSDYERENSIYHIYLYMVKK